MISPETQMTIAEYRALARDGTASVEQLRRALQLLRGDRTRAQTTSTKAKTTKAAKAADKDIDSDALLAQLKMTGF